MPFIAQVIFWPDGLAEVIKDLRKARRRIAFTNGCFDLLHLGHVQSLVFARSLADVLVVAVNDDASVRRLKGSMRPVIPLADRAAMLAALRVVDFVVAFSGDTATDVVACVAPDVYVKGGNYDVANIPEGRLVLQQGGSVASAPLVEGISTTMMLERLQRRES